MNHVTLAIINDKLINKYNHLFNILDNFHIFRTLREKLDFLLYASSIKYPLNSRFAFMNERKNSVYTDLLNLNISNFQERIINFGFIPDLIFELIIYIINISSFNILTAMSSKFKNYLCSSKKAVYYDILKKLDNTYKPHVRISDFGNKHSKFINIMFNNFTITKIISINDNSKSYMIRYNDDIILVTENNSDIDNKLINLINDILQWRIKNEYPDYKRLSY